MISKKEKKPRKDRERGRKGGKGEGEGYKSPWSPIKFMNLDLDRSSVVTVLKYFFLAPDTFFALSLVHGSIDGPVVSGVRLFAVCN